MPSESKPSGVQSFDNPTRAPGSTEEAQRWQNANRTFWQTTPMRYDWKKSIAPKEFSPEFYQEIDTRFLTEARKMLPWKSVPFDTLIDFDKLRQQDVLEIGVGCGTHAEILASHARSFTGIDLTDYAPRCTNNRLALKGIQAKVVQMDAEKMEFPENSFDFIWSWGVIHHSSNTRQILSEMNRVLRPGGTATVMVYHRSFWHYYIMTGFFHGILQGQLFRDKSIHKVMQRNIDGALARFYKSSEWQAETSGLFAIDRMQVVGPKTDLFPLPAGKFKDFVMSLVPNAVSRFFTNTLGFGTFLVAQMTVTKGSE